ncbi:YSIRK-type signal peptide-containing protein, partial [Streptococcus suis]
MFKDQSKKMIKKQEYFSLRKFKRGLASVTVGATLFMAGAALETLVVPQAAVVYAAEETYSVNGNWTFTDNIPTSNTNVNPQMTAWDYTPHTAGQTTVTQQDGSTVTVTATITPTNGNGVGVSYLVPGDDQSYYKATAEMLAGNPDPASIPAMGIYLQPSPSTPGTSLADKLNYSGVVENAELTLTFSEEVTNPIIDLSGVGGSGKAIVDDTTGRVYVAKGSFNSTNFELITPGVKFEQLTGTNLTVTDTTLQVTEKNTYDKAVVGADDLYLGDYRLPNMVPAGTGSIRLVGTFKQVTFKLYHQTTPFSEYPTATYQTSPLFFDNGRIGDGVNGLNKFWSDSVREVSDSTTNADLLRFSVRLSNTKYGSVVVNYVDTEGNVIGTEFKDTTKQEVGTTYDTTPNTGTVASDATTERPAVITKDGKTYKLVAKETTATVGTVNADGSLSENAGSFTFGTDTPTGTVAEGTKSITYVYEEVKGSVIV